MVNNSDGICDCDSEFVNTKLCRQFSINKLFNVWCPQNFKQKSHVCIGICKYLTNCDSESESGRASHTSSA